MKTWRIVLGAGLVCTALAACGTYRDPNYKPFELSAPQRGEAPQNEAYNVHERLRSRGHTTVSAPGPETETEEDAFLKALAPEEIATIQSFLNANGFVAGLENGYFTPRTETAIRSYQRANRLGVTGKPDEEMLYKAYTHFGDTPPYNPAREALISGIPLDDGTGASDGSESDWVTPDF